MSIRLRLTLYWAIVLSTLLLLAGVLVFLLFQRQQWGRLDSALMEEADTVAETISRLGPAAAQPIVLRLSEERDLGPRRRVWLVRHGRQIADAGVSDADLPAPDLTRLGRTMVDGRAHTFRYAIVPLGSIGADSYLVDGVDATAVRESVARLRTSLLLVLPILLIISVSLGYWLADRALAPLIAVTGGLAALSARDVSRRLPCAAIDDEVADLIRAINSLLERVERASAAQRRFVADAAHELRTPLAVLRSGIEVALRRERSAEEYAQTLNAALRDAAALCAMADDLLALTQLDREHDLQREAVDLNALTREVLETFEPLAEARQLVLKTELGGPLPIVANQHYLRRVIVNLLDNALKFTPAGGQIELALAAGDGHASLRVADNGAGIAEAERPFIFNRFFRGKSHPDAGNGLGLSLCREIVELHGGEISAANRPGGGAEFVVTLPASST